ncbi:hypothetical protein HYC85_020167 [Camellia sinensis]|uniref:S-acyltransferase n=1 Tax=Camellia sinensis TaxID=4442 RepID=A0A7J7GQP8_CAMSI|nr:hypothetical protein HYC85_020167 [Camellia sinensis]
MVRRHGWQLPAHTFQVVAITVFCLLVVAFYAFFAPFLGGQIWEYALFGTYSLVALLVFILYVRSTAINPADPGIMSKFDFGYKPNSKLELSTNSRKFNELGTATHSSPSSARSSMTGVHSVRKGSEEQTRIDTQMEPPSGRSSCHIVGGILCAAFVHEDCRKQDEAADQQGTGEDALYCTLCEAEVRKFSKHCRSCDKCVDGFDHHCRLVIEAGVGIAVLVRCFVHKKSMEADIVDRLGHGFSLAPFATVVAVCTAVSMLACVPLGELFFFHMILIRKGITTYEYVVAMRAMSEAPAGGSVDEELGNVLYSPTGSATTGFSGGSSLGLQYKGAWCTPPRVFVDYQEEVVPHLDPGMVPSTVDPDAAGNKLPKRPVRISAWKLAKLDSNEAVRAAAKARASSSVLRPVDNQRMQDPELSSSGNLSVRSSVSTDMGGNKDAKNEFKLSPLRNSFGPSQGSRDEYETGTQSVSSFSSPSHVHDSVTLSPLPQAHGLSHFSVVAGSKPSFVQDRPTQSSREALPSIISNPISHISAGFDEKIVQRRSSAGDPLLHSGPATSLLRDIKRTSVVWDQEAGRYVSVPVSASEARGRPSWQTIASNPNIEISSSDRRPVVLPREPSSSVAKAPLEQSEKLMYTGESIFFGGPLLSVPVRDRLGNEKSGLRRGQDRVVLNLARESTSNPLRSSGVFELNPPAGSSGLKNK